MSSGNAALGSSEELPGGASAGLAPYPFGARSGPLGAWGCWWKGGEEGRGTFAECQGIPRSSSISWASGTIGAKEFVRNRYILNHISFWMVIFFPPCAYKLGEAFLEDFENQVFTFSTKEKQAHFT